MAQKITKYRFILFAALALISSVFLSILFGIDAFTSWHQRLTHQWYEGEKPHKDIVIIQVDEKTMTDARGFGTGIHLREAFTRMLTYINAAQPKVIGFDVLLDQKTNTLSFQALEKILSKPDADAQLTSFQEGALSPIDGPFQEALLASQNVVLAAVGHPKNPNQLMINGYPRVDFAQIPIDEFLFNADIGFVNKSKSDDVIYSFPLGVYSTTAKQPFESFSTMIARLHLGKAEPNLPQKLGGKHNNIPLEDGEFIINYAGPPFSYQYYSLVDVYDKKIPASAFKDKIVLIGATDSAFQDLFFTPTSGKHTMPGVEIHANAIQTILDGRFLRNATTTETIAMIAVATILIVVIAAFLPVLVSLIILLALGALYTFAAKLAFNNGLILNMIYPYAALLIGFSGAYLIRFFAERMQRQRLQGAFGQYVNKDIAENIAGNLENVEVGGEKRTLTTLFSDIQSFTTISEKLTPEQLVAFLNEYLAEMTAIIQKFGGTIDKFEGDAIMAFWGAPAALKPEDGALKAAQAVTAMQARLKEINPKWQQKGIPTIVTRIGLNTGDAIVGNIGTEGKLDYTAIGDSINLASRLEGANKYFGTRTMVSETTAYYIQNACTLRELDFITVKGKEKPLRIYELIASTKQVIPAWQNILETFANGLGLYRSRNFNDAHAAFSEILKSNPHDGPAKVMAARCEQFMKNPPPEGWNGVYNLTGK